MTRASGRFQLVYNGEIYNHREIRDRLGALLDALPERQRAVVALRHYQEMSLEEIARALDMRIGTVKSTLHRALARMREGAASGRCRVRVPMASWPPLSTIRSLVRTAIPDTW